MIEEIPRSYRYVCDSPRCKRENGLAGFHLQQNASGHYTNSCPPGWWVVTIRNDSSPAVETLLCPACVEKHVGLRNACRIPGETESSE